MGKIVLVEVALGNIETASKPDKTRKSQSAKYDSVLVSDTLKQNPNRSKQATLKVLNTTPYLQVIHWNRIQTDQNTQVMIY